MLTAFPVPTSAQQWATVIRYLQNELMNIFKRKKKVRETLFLLFKTVLFPDDVWLENMNCSCAAGARSESFTVMLLQIWSVTGCYPKGQGQLHLSVNVKLCDSFMYTWN